MIERLQEAVNADAALVHQARWLTADMLLEIGEARHLVKIREGRITEISAPTLRAVPYDFSIKGTAEAWREFWQPIPKPRHHDIMALIREGRMSIGGNLELMMAHFLTLKRMLEKPRGNDANTRSPTVKPHIEPVVGRYMQLAFQGSPHRLYWEEAGPVDGIPLLCLHTAGADGRQYRALLNDPEITKTFRVIAFDMPWHGKSSPPEGWHDEEYKLTTDTYVDLVCTVAEALGLNRPVVMGCSIGGRIVLELARTHPDRFRSVIGLQSSAFVQHYFDITWLHRPNIHGGEMSAAYCYGLVGPQAPLPHRWETLWHYMQSGPGVFKGDLHFYSIDGDISSKLSEIDTAICPVYMLTGEYDYSCTPQSSQETASLIAGAKFRVMERLGHFPMSEDPETFKRYLMPVLNDISAAAP